MGKIQKFDKYILLEELEKHVFGTSWRAAELKNGKIEEYYLIDFLNQDLAGNSAFSDSFLGQAMTTAQMEHTNILKMVLPVTDGQRLAMVSDFQEGFSLRAVIDRSREQGFPFSVDHALLVSSKILMALEHAKGQHLSHGLIVPSTTFVTHEGEILIKGFAIGAAIKTIINSTPNLRSKISNYLPPDTGASAEVCDIFGCGAILFEMLTGEPFPAAEGVTAAKLIQESVTASEGEPIPEPIRHILLKALVRGTAESYLDIKSMAADMEKILFSADHEFSPTTFNLAFFMHSVFREEMESATEKLAQEKATDFSNQVTQEAPAPPQRTAPSQPAARVQVEMPEEPVMISQPSTAPAKSGLKMPMMIGAAALAAVIIIVAVFIMKGRGEGSQDASVAQQQAELLAEQQKSEADRLKEHQEFLKQQNEMLMAQLEEKNKREREARKQKIQEQMAAVDREITRIAQEKEAEESENEKKLKAQIEQMQEEIKRLESQEQERDARIAQAKRIKDQSNSQDQPAASTQVKTQSAGADNKSGQPPQGTDGALTEPPVAQPDKATTASPDPAPTSNNETTASTGQVASINPVSPPATSVMQPPKEGAVVELLEMIQQPLLQKTIPPQQVPSKAIRSGVIKKGQNLRIIMRALIGTDGAVEEVAFHSSTIPKGKRDFGMIETASAVVKDLTYTPPTHMGVKVKVWMFVPVTFWAR